MKKKYNPFDKFVNEKPPFTDPVVVREHDAGPRLTIHRLVVNGHECELQLGDPSTLSRPNGTDILEDMSPDDLAEVIRALALRFYLSKLDQR